MREEKGTTEDEMVGWHHQLDGHELNKLQGMSSLALTYLLSLPRIRSVMSEVTQFSSVQSLSRV